jgi:23S rRNA (pseudouridine1915-N3)-methyltransferase
MNFTIIAVGRLKDKFFKDASDEYIKRLNAFGKLSVIEIEAISLSDNPSDIEISKALEKEAASIIDKIPKSAALIPLCIEGKQYSSEELSSLFDDFANSGVSNICFIIGGSVGLDDNIKKLGKIKLSMSKMTFPHRLARIMLLEQIYRACTISAGMKYHK